VSHATDAEAVCYECVLLLWLYCEG